MASVPKTTIMNKAVMNIKEPIQVYCRIRPMENQDEVSCLKIISPSTVQMSLPDTAVNFRYGSSKETQYTFSHVFDQDTEQQCLFKELSLPMVDGLLHGKNGLLFTYGVSGSGKILTMTGTPQNSCIMPRSLDVLFNSISNGQAKRFIFKPNRLNGFDTQSEEDAKIYGLNERQSQISASKTSKVQRQDEHKARYTKQRK